MVQGSEEPTNGSVFEKKKSTQNKCVVTFFLITETFYVSNRTLHA